MTFGSFRAAVQGFPKQTDFEKPSNCYENF